MLFLLTIGLLHSVPKQTDQADASQDAPNHSQNTVAVAILTYDPIADQENNSANSEAHQPSWCEQVVSPLIANWPLVIVAGVGIWVANRTLRAINRQAEVMQSQLELSQRPWVSVVRLPQALQFDPDGAKVGCIVKLENCGGSVAWNVSVWTELVPTEKDWRPVLERLRNIPENPVNAKSDYGHVLFPKADTSQYQPTILPRKDLDDSVQNGAFKDSGKIGFMLVGCVDYRSYVSPEHYQTTFVDLVGYLDQTRGGRNGSFRSDGESLSADHSHPAWTWSQRNLKQAAKGKLGTTAKPLTFAYWIVTSWL